MRSISSARPCQSTRLLTPQTDVADQQNRMVNDLSNPFHVVVTPDGNRVVASTGFTSRAGYAAFLTDAPAKWNAEAKVAQLP